MALLGASAGAGAAGPPALPDAVRPGAQRPQPERPLPPPAAQPPLEVPPAAERPLEPHAGPKVRVRAFDLVGVVERPRLGITRTAIGALLEAERAAHPEGFTIGELDLAARKVTDFYRQRGLILAQAFVPVQTVRDGRVILQVLEGRLGRVRVEGNERYDAALLEAAFAPYVGEPVVKDALEQAMLRVTDFPGLSVFGVFEPGDAVGTADLVLKVQKEKRFDLALRHDNHGLRETGERRSRVQVAWNNPTGGADVLRLSSQINTKPKDAFFWRVAYERPIIDPSWRARVSFDRNTFDVLGAFADQGIFSSTLNGHVALEKNLVRSRRRNVYVELDGAKKRAQTKIRGTPVSRDELTTLTARVRYDGVDARFGGLNYATIEFVHGFDDLFGAMGGQGHAQRAAVPPSRLGGGRQFATGHFDRLFVSAQRLQGLEPLWQALRHQSLLLRFDGQWSDDLLVPLEQFAVGGPTSVRAYQPTERLFDSGLYASVEWMVAAPGFADAPSPFSGRTWGELVRWSMFYDFAWGEVNDPAPGEDPSDNFRGVGTSVVIDNPNVFSLRATLAWPLGERPRSRNGRLPQAWLDINLFF